MGGMQGSDVYVGCKVAMAELIMSGCTTTSDHHYVFPNDVQVQTPFPPTLFRRPACGALGSSSFIRCLQSLDEAHHPFLNPSTTPALLKFDRTNAGRQLRFYRK